MADGIPFSNVTDFFGLGGGVLVPVESNDGRRVDVTKVADGARYVRHAKSTELPSPSTVYTVASAGSFSFTLGTAYGGCMLVSVSVETGNGRFPRVTATGVANEGKSAQAVILGEVPSITVSVLPDIWAQDPAGAFSGDLVSCSTTWSVTPLVCFRDDNPSASDVTGLVATATGEWYVRPGTAGGWIVTAVSDRGASGAYPTVSVTAEKHL